VAKTKGAPKGARKPAARAKRTKAPPKPKVKPAPRASRAVARPVAAPASPPAPPPPARPVPPPPRDELTAPRDVGRLLRYGERFGPHKIDIRMLPQQLPVATAALALCDPGAPKSWRVLDRPVTAGRFRVMLSIARRDGAPDQLAAFVVHTGQPPIAKWTVAHVAGHKKPRSADQLPRVEVTTGWLALVDAGDGMPGPLAVAAASPALAPVDLALTDGRIALAVPCPNGAYAAYWAVDAADKPVCLVVDFDVFTQKDWKARPT